MIAVVMREKDEIAPRILGKDHGLGVDVILGLHNAGEERIQMHQGLRGRLEDEMALLQPEQDNIARGWLRASESGEEIVWGVHCHEDDQAVGFRL
jgi:hypothetical protein